MPTYILKRLTKEKLRVTVLSRSLADLDTRTLPSETTIDAVNTSASQLV